MTDIATHTEAQLVTAADMLFRNARDGVLDPAGHELLAHLGRNATPEQGLATQLLVLDRWLADGQALGGWKAGLTSMAARDRMGPGFRPFGYVLTERIHRSGDTLTLSGIRTPKVETEICLTLGADLVGPDVTAAQARDAVASVAPALEITEQRLTQPLPDFVNIANDLGQWGIVVGPGHAPDLDLHHIRVEFYQDDQLIDAATASPEVVDDPYLSLARICNELGNHGRGLIAGQHVITGALVRFPAVEHASTWRAVFDPIGEVRITFV